MTERHRNNGISLFAFSKTDIDRQTAKISYELSCAIACLMFGFYSACYRNYINTLKCEMLYTQCTLKY